jgi:hypothetical protein
MKNKWLAFALLLCGSAVIAPAQVSFGITIGPPPPPRVIVRPIEPGPGYAWVEGYWYPVGNHYRWHDGYWTRPPYGGALWVAPYYDGRQYFGGHWEGDRGRFEHDHRWDRDRRVRDYDRRHDRDDRHDRQ